MRNSFSKGGRLPSLGALPTSRSCNRLSAAGGGGGGSPPPLLPTLNAKVPLPGTGGSGGGGGGSASSSSPTRRASRRRAAALRAVGWALAGVALLLLAGGVRSGGRGGGGVAARPPARLPAPGERGGGASAATLPPPPVPTSLPTIAAAAAALASAGHSPGAVRAAWRRAAAPGMPRPDAVVDESPAAGGGLASPPSRRAPPPPSLAADVAALVAGLASAAGGVRQCAWDPSLDPGGVIPARARTLVAADARNLGPTLAPHWVLQAATLLASLPAGGGFLSVYESGSDDGGASAAWLGVARDVAAALGAPARVVTAGRLTRPPGADRIAFLAAARNRALEPLWLDPGDPEGWDPAGLAAGVRDPLEVAPPAPGNASGGPPPANNATAARPGPAPLPPGPPSPVPPLLPPPSTPEWEDGGAGGGDGGAAAATRGWPAHRVLFLNDVFWCAGDGLRLLAHTVGGASNASTAPADVACGLDFDRPRLQDAPLADQAELWAVRTQRSWPFLPRPLLRAAARGFPDALLKGWATEGSPADAAYQAGARLEFYDIWVARDVDGRRLAKRPPYASDPHSIARLASGLPFPASCCWNGMVALPAAPFRDQGLRMRAAAPGECAASECSLLCNDLHRLGRGRFLIDPGVRLAYTPADAGDVADPAFVAGSPPSSWADVAAGPALDWASGPPGRRPYWEACCLPPGADAIHWDTDCGWDDWAAPDWTASTLVPGRGVASGEWGSGGGPDRRGGGAGGRTTAAAGVAAVEGGPPGAPANGTSAAERRQVLRQSQEQVQVQQQGP